jgi:hypothetical protein
MAATECSGYDQRTWCRYDVRAEPFGQCRSPRSRAHENGLKPQQLRSAAVPSSLETDFFDLKAHGSINI